MNIPRLAVLFLSALVRLSLAPCTHAQSPVSVAGFNTYTAALESRLAQQHRLPDYFIVLKTSAPLGLQPPVLEQLTPSGGLPLPGALLHHWRGTAFIPGATVASFEHLLKDFNAYPQHFAPEVLRAAVVSSQADHLQAFMRVSQRHIITVVLDSTYDITFGRLDSDHGYSRSHSLAISEVQSAGTPGERTLTAAQEHGFLWRLNTYWSYQQRDGGLLVQIESVSLTRSIPTGLGWAIKPFIESVPRDSLAFTLQSVCNALRR